MGKEFIVSNYCLKNVSVSLSLYRGSLPALPAQPVRSAFMVRMLLSWQRIQ